MKRKLIFMTLLVWACFQTLEAMIPGPPLLAECPKCGKEKRLMSIVSGNTIGAIVWSDMYMEAPMLPRLSPVQKCPYCQSYFLLGKAEYRYEESDELPEGELPYATDLGKLTYPEMKEALCLLEEDSLDTEDEITIRMEFLHRYNDAFRGSDSEGGDSFGLTMTEEDNKINLSNIKELIRLLDGDQYMLLKSELLRESGDFEKSMDLLYKYRPESEYERRIAKTIIRKGREGDRRVFLIEED